MKSSTALRAAIIAAAFISACGGGGGDDKEVVAPPPSPMSVEITQAGALLTEVGQTQQLVAVVRDLAGNVMLPPPTITWNSSDTSSVSVGPTGVVKAVKSNGSSQITARVNDLSAAVLIVVTQLASGVDTVPDSAVVRGPIETNPDAEPSINNTYSVIVAASERPAVGSLLVGTGQQAIAGRVVSLKDVPEGVKVTLELPPIADLFPNLLINETMSLIPDEAETTEKASKSKVVREGSYIFDNKAASSLFSSCKSDAGKDNEGNLPFISATIPPALDFSVKNPSLKLIYTPGRGLEQFVISADLSQKSDLELSISAGISGGFNCKYEVASFRIPISGPLSWFFAGKARLGFKFKFEADGNTPAITLKSVSEIKGTPIVGIQCPTRGECNFYQKVDNFSAVAKTKDILPEKSIRVDVGLSTSLYLQADIGNPIIKKLQVNLAEATAGAKLKGSFASLAGQISDSQYKSKFTALFVAGVEAGKDIKATIAKIFKGSITNPLKYEIERELIATPTGTVTANKAKFASGEEVKFKVVLNHVDSVLSSVFSGFSGKEILIVRRLTDSSGSTGAAIVARALLSPDQESLEISTSPSQAGTADEFYAFALTELLPTDKLALEIGQATGEGDALGTLSLHKNGAFRGTVKLPDGWTNVSLANQPVNGTASFDAENSKIIYTSNGTVGLDKVVLQATSGNASVSGYFEIIVRENCSSDRTVENYVSESCFYEPSVDSVKVTSRSFSKEQIVSNKVRCASGTAEVSSALVTEAEEAQSSRSGTRTLIRYLADNSIIPSSAPECGQSARSKTAQTFAEYSPTESSDMAIYPRTIVRGSLAQHRSNNSIERNSVIISSERTIDSNGGTKSERTTVCNKKEYFVKNSEGGVISSGINTSGSPFESYCSDFIKSFEGINNLVVAPF